MGALADTVTLKEAANRGVRLCRQGEWDEGLQVLGWVAERSSDSTELPSLFYSYLGYGIAWRQRKPHEGLMLCEHAVQSEFYQPENYVNLARTHLLAGRRLSALRALEQGLRVDPEDARLHDLIERIELRRRPVLPFLQRSNPFNYALGYVRHHVLRLLEKSPRSPGSDHRQRSPSEAVPARARGRR